MTCSSFRGSIDNVKSLRRQQEERRSVNVPVGVNGRECWEETTRLDVYRFIGQTNSHRAMAML